MADRYRRDHDYGNYGYDEDYGSSERREDPGESPMRSGRTNDERVRQARAGERHDWDRNEASRRGSEGRHDTRFGADERDLPRYAANRPGMEGRFEPRYGADRDFDRERRDDWGSRGRSEPAWRRDDEWPRGQRGDESGGMSTSRDPWQRTGANEWSRSGSSYDTRFGPGTSSGANRGEDWRNPGMGSWSRESSSRQFGFGSESTGGARGGGFSGRGPKDYKRSDERIREDVCDRLSDDDDLDASDITVAVLNAEVTLEGHVTDRRSKHRAEDIADSVSGVRDVHNRLRAKKSFFQEMGDRLTGRDEAEQHGHHGSGTRNAPTTSSTTASTTSVKNGVSEPNRSM